ncbi:hypothetical protein Tco_0511634 [Tanacetum coccineum]
MTGDSGCWPDMVVWMIMTMSVEWWSGVEMMKVLWGGRSGGGSSEVAARWEKAAGMEVVSWGCEGDEMMWWGGCSMFNFGRTSLTGFPAQSVRSSNAYALDSPYLLVLNTDELLKGKRQHDMSKSDSYYLSD